MQVIYVTLIAGLALAAVAYEWLFGVFLDRLAKGKDTPEWSMPSRDPDPDGAAARPLKCLRCEFDLRGLKMAQSPRCNALVGFDESMKQLGLNADEIADIQSKDKKPRKKRNRESKSA